MGRRHGRMPVAVRGNRVPACRRNQLPARQHGGMMNPNMNGFFGNGLTSVNGRDATRHGRIQAQTITRTATMQDSRGNKVTMNETQTMVNAPDDFYGQIHFQDHSGKGIHARKHTKSGN